MQLTVAVTTGRRGRIWYSVTSVVLTKRRRVGTGYIMKLTVAATKGRREEELVGEIGHNIMKLTVAVTNGRRTRTWMESWDLV